ncbi:MAG: OmpA family protein [Flavisolibacter sp.]|nr:OmpA family protein [Flavisolibacter sp.]
MIKLFFTAITCTLLLFGFSAGAQDSEFSLSAGGGLSGLKYDLPNGASKLKPGFQAGIGYTKFYNSRWGLTTGLGLGYYQSRATLTPNTVFSSHSVDSENNAFEFRVKTKGYEEKQNLYALQIPVMVQFQSPSKTSTQLYAQGGVKLGIPVSSSYQTKADEINASGYYPDVNAEITDLPAHGFGTQTNWSGKGDYDFKLSYSLAAETGARFRLSTGNYLYAGLFIDYGLNNLKKQEGDQTLLTYHPTAISQSQATGVFSLANTTGDVRLLAYGIKLRIGIGSKEKKTAPPVKEVYVETPALPVQTAEKPKEEELVVTVTEQKIIPEATKDTLTTEEEQFIQTSLQFSKVGDTVLSPSAQAEADKLAQFMQRHSHIELQIEGHTCNLGGPAVNQRISIARAKAVATYLEHKGIDPSRLHIVAKGAAEPIVPNTSEANRKQNRRVVIKVVE